MGDVVEFECVVNLSGIEPVDVKVLVLPDKVEERTSGGIIMPNEARERQQMAQTKATLVAVGGEAFMDGGEPWSGLVPQPGDRLIVDRYAGVKCDGADGETYQLINDKDVLAVLVEEK